MYALLKWVGVDENKIVFNAKYHPKQTLMLLVATNTIR